MADAAKERVTVGLVRGIHGLEGTLRVEVLSDRPDRFEVGSVLHLEGEDAPLTVAWSQESKPGILVRFDELDSREAAQRMRDRYLEAVADQPLPDGSWYWHQIKDLVVRTTDGRELGRVVDVFRAGGGEVYVVRGGPLGELMVPGVSGIVVELDPEAGHMVVDPIALALPDKPPRRRRRHETTRRMRGSIS